MALLTDDDLGSWNAGHIVRTMFPLLIGLCVIVLWAGISLNDADALLDQYGLLAVMVPAMIGMGGNLGSIMSARLSTRLHLGTTTFDPTDQVLWANVAGIFALAATVFTALAIGVWLIGQVVGTGLRLWQLLVISLGSGLAIAGVAVIASVVATYGSYRRGVDPDDTTIPIVTNVVDVFGVIVFLAVARLVLGG